MKKIFAVCLSVLLCAGVAFAQPPSITTNSMTNPTAAGGSSDFAQDYTYNDGAWATGGSGGSVQNFGTAGTSGYGPSTSFAIGAADAKGVTGAVAGAADFGKTSVAGAAIGTVVDVKAGGVSGFGGINGMGAAYNESNGMVQGSVDQGNYAQEIGYGSGTFAQAQNTSGASFYGYTSDRDFDFDMSGRCNPFYGDAASSGVHMTGMAGTAGGSVASVDPYGNHQSAFAATGNISGAAVFGADCKQTNVYGNGQVAVGANAQTFNGGASAGGQGSFGYTGNTLGSGVSVMNANANAGNGTFSSSASGASFSVAK